ncbi:SURF1 family protein [Rothia sp. ZJ932]|uniref:SURF1 family cytochrome oxidase biogenesis protein n=1 Tax=Rothia sp. ZJ932 TaxID=2810516 RepID=UPI001966F035|nr:SURF1 family protein [Rothia sp. ZJ932]QRZ60774.1 SURF1 family protein [Rothia sp. ZJ932]
MTVYRFLLSGKWVGAFALCVAFSILCLFLANWQMERKEEVDYRNQLIADNFNASPVNLSEHEGAFDTFDEQLKWQPITLRGEYVSDEQVLARNRPYHGVNGFEVLVPFVTVQGEAVLISRGWVPAGFGDALAPEQEVGAPPAGEVTIVARYHNSEMDTGRGAPEGQIASIYLPDLAKMTGVPVGEAAYGLLVSEDPAVPSTPIVKEAPEQDTGPNLSYSMQWYAFAILIYVVYAWSARQKVRNDELDAQLAAELEKYYGQFYDEEGNYVGEEDEDIIIRKMQMVDDMPSHLKSIMRPAPARSKKRRTDEDEEDAYLDSLGM